MSMQNIRKIIHAALFTPTRSGWGLPILFWGKPGIGKSDIVEEAAAVYRMPIEVLSPGERGEGGYGCTPMPDADGYISYPAPRWTEKFDKAQLGFLFHDEINTAPPAIQAPLLGLLLKRRIGGAQLCGRVRQMAAANDVADAAGGWDLAPPMANRLGHLPWEAPNESEWTEWLMAADYDPQPSEPAEQIEKRVEKAWNAEWAKARGIVSGFIRAKPHALHKQPASGSPEASKAWPSHRSWEAATRALASARVHAMSEADGDMFAAAFVGSGIIGELITYRADADLPDPTALLDGKVAWKPDFKRLDRTFAVVGSTTSIMMNDVQTDGGADKAKKNTKTMKRWDVFTKLLTEVANNAVDLCWSSAKSIARAGMHNATPDSAVLMRKLLPMINAVEGK